MKASPRHGGASAVLPVLIRRGGFLPGAAALIVLAGCSNNPLIMEGWFSRVLSASTAPDQRINYKTIHTP